MYRACVCQLLAYSKMSSSDYVYISKRGLYVEVGLQPLPSPSKQQN